MTDYMEFKAYRGSLMVSHTWARGHAANMEKEAYQARLDRGELTRVDVAIGGVWTAPFTLHQQRVA